MSVNEASVRVKKLAALGAHDMERPAVDASSAMQVKHGDFRSRSVTEIIAITGHSAEQLLVINGVPRSIMDQIERDGELTPLSVFEEAVEICRETGQELHRVVRSMFPPPVQRHAHRARVAEVIRERKRTRSAGGQSREDNAT